MIMGRPKKIPNCDIIHTLVSNLGIQFLPNDCDSLTDTRHVPVNTVLLRSDSDIHFCSWLRSVLLGSLFIPHPHQHLYNSPIHSPSAPA